MGKVLDICRSASTFLTYSLGIPAHELKNTVYELLRGTVTLKETITKIGDRGWSFAPISTDMGEKRREIKK